MTITASTTMFDTLQRNYGTLQEKVAAACAASGRPADSVTVVAVVKYAEIDWVRGLMELGVRDLGESRPQQLLERSAPLGDDVRWHLIGHLQRNKIRKILPLTTLIHSIDSWKLLRAVDRVAEELNLKPQLLLQVNVSGEESKGGFEPAALKQTWETVATFQHVEVRGFMTMAPASRDLGEARETFARLRMLRDELAAGGPPEISLPDLSMGMSGDFEVAIAEGATLVRIGSSLFEGLS